MLFEVGLVPEDWEDPADLEEGEEFKVGEQLDTLEIALEGSSPRRQPEMRDIRSVLSFKRLCNIMNIEEKKLDKLEVLSSQSTQSSASPSVRGRDSAIL